MQTSNVKQVNKETHTPSTGHKWEQVQNITLDFHTFNFLKAPGYTGHGFSEGRCLFWDNVELRQVPGSLSLAVLYAEGKSMFTSLSPYHFCFSACQ